MVHEAHRPYASSFIHGDRSTTTDMYGRRSNSGRLAMLPACALVGGHRVVVVPTTVAGGRVLTFGRHAWRCACLVAS